ncbi:MAG: M56 family metallopeptidase [Saccharofermentans sp.]|nr:M56 family metallopeptidase [Saccharofermentans sp.]
MLRYVFGISLITVAILAIRFFAKDRISKRLQYALWLLVPLFMLVAPVYSINITLPARQVVVDEQVTTPQIHHKAVTDQKPVPLNDNQANGDSDKKYVIETVSEEPVKTINWAETLTKVTYAVSGVFIGSIIVFNLGFIIYCNKKRTFIEIDSNSNLNVYRFDHDSAPFLLGKDIYLSDKVASKSEMTKYAICHEYCHYKHGDTLWAIVRFIVLAVNWYNPLIWYAFVISEQDCELACDEAVLEKIGEEKRVEYGKVLLTLLADRSLGKHDFYLTTAMYGRSKNFMRDRITNIKKNRKTTVVPVVISLIVALVATGCSLLKFNQEEAETETNEIHETDHQHSAIKTEDGDAYLKVNPNTKVVLDLDSEESTPGGVLCSYPPVFDTDIDDGYYTVSMYNHSNIISVSTEDGNDYEFEAATFIPWIQVEVNSDYINRLLVGDEISYAKYEDEETTIEVEHLNLSTVEPFSRYGTDYSGNILSINDSENYAFYEVEGGETWKLFSSSDTPEFTYSLDRILPISEECVIYDSVTWLITEGDVVASMSTDELTDALTFKDTSYTKGYIDMISDMYFFKDAGPDYYYDYTVIKVENNEITEIYFWNHP